MNAHTPGPWMVVHELRPNDEAVADLVNNTWVIPERPVRLGSWHADAALIAAAPDLLDALRDLDSRLRACFAIPGVADAYDSAYQDSVADAIAKATGVTP